MKGRSVDPYILRADGAFHTSDVRHVAFGCLTPNGDHNRFLNDLRNEDARIFKDEGSVVLLTSSRDNTAELSTIPVKSLVDESDSICAQRALVGHEAFVNVSLLHKEGLDFLCRHHPGKPAVERTGPFIVTGSNDCHVLVWSIEPTRLEAVLDGHRSGVTCADVIRIREPLPQHGVAAASSPGTPQATDDALVAQGYHGDIVTGDWAGVILVFSHKTGKVRVSYNGHQNAIRGLVHLPSTSLIVSVSGDKSIHCWDVVRVAEESGSSSTPLGPVSRVLMGHEDVVQCVCYMGNNRKEEGGGSSFYSYFATGSNDCTVRLWAVENQLRDAHPLKTLSGHDSLVYGMCFNPCSGELMSASEDRTVRVWGLPPNERGAEAAEGVPTPKEERGVPSRKPLSESFFHGFRTVHVVPHPCVVWSVASCRVKPSRVSMSGETGNEEEEEEWEDLLLTGGADSIVRLWTRKDENFASVDKLEALEQAIAAQTVDIKLVGGGGSPIFDMQHMPSVDQLHEFKGKAEGEKKFFKNEAGEVEVYVWANARWDKIGVVVADNQPVSAGSAAAGGGTRKPREKRVYKGAYYDYVFDVDVEGRMLQLPYNAGGSVLEAAQDFINEHSVLSRFDEEASASAASVPAVSQEHKEQIVNFIMQNIDPADIQRIPGLGAGDAQGPPAAAAARNKCALLEEDQLWPTAELVEGFSTDGAQRKTTEILTQSAPGKVAAFSGVMHQLQQQLSTNAKVSTADVQAMASSLADLFAVLPVGKKFPAIDALRYAMAQSPEHAAEFLVALQPYIAASPGGQSPGYTPATDGEALVFTRLVSNMLPASMTAQQSTSPTTASSLRKLMKEALTTTMPTVAKVNAAANNSLQYALASFYLRNLAVLLRVFISRGECAGAEGRQAFASFKANMGIAEKGSEEEGVLQCLTNGFIAVLQPLLARRNQELEPLLLCSAATAGAALAHATATSAALTAFKEALPQTLMSVPAGQSLADALKQ